MRSALFFLFCAASGFGADFVNLNKYDATIVLDMKYATIENFTKTKVYPEAICAFREPVAKALSRVQTTLKLQGYSLKIWDCYRPLSVQKKFWELVPDERYVADPAKGSRHNRGAAVDLTLIDLSGKPIEMPTEFDDFTDRAHRTSNKITKAARRNLKILDKAMVAEGFTGLPTEWWHYDFVGWEKFGIEDKPLSDFR